MKRTVQSRRHFLTTLNLFVQHWPRILANGSLYTRAMGLTRHHFVADRDSLLTCYFLVCSWSPKSYWSVRYDGSEIVGDKGKDKDDWYYCLCRTFHRGELSAREWSSSSSKCWMRRKRQRHGWRGRETCKSDGILIVVSSTLFIGSKEVPGRLEKSATEYSGWVSSKRLSKTRANLANVQ